MNQTSNVSDSLSNNFYASLKGMQVGMIGDGRNHLALALQSIQEGDLDEMTVKQLKTILKMVDDNSQVRIEITDSEYNITNVEVHTYEVDGDYFVLQGENDD